jgi:Flp pilus assembly protein TadB
MSAWVLGALPAFLLIGVSVLNAGYMDPMYQGWGLVWLAGCAVMTAIGVGMINKMSKVEV